MKTKIALILVSLLSISAFASEYSDDTVVGTTCERQADVQVCRGIQPANGWTDLQLMYWGKLIHSRGLQVLVRINYADGSRSAQFPMQTYYDMPADARITGGCLAGRMGGCDQPAPQSMRDLLIYSQQYGGKMNALSLDLAFTDADGRWDNNGRDFGTYHFEFKGQ